MKKAKSFKLAPVAVSIATLMMATSAMAFKKEPPAQEPPSIDFHNALSVSITKHIHAETTSHFDAMGLIPIFSSAQAVSDVKQTIWSSYVKNKFHTNRVNAESSYNGNRGAFHHLLNAGDANQVKLNSNISASNALVLHPLNRVPGFLHLPGPIERLVNRLGPQSLAKVLAGLGRVDAESFTLQKSSYAHVKNKGAMNRVNISDSFSRNHGITNASIISGNLNQHALNVNIASGPGVAANADSGSLQQMSHNWVKNRPFKKRLRDRTTVEGKIWLSQMGEAIVDLDASGEVDVFGPGTFEVLGDGTLSGLVFDGTINGTVTHNRRTVRKASRNRVTVDAGSFSQNQGILNAGIISGNLNQVNVSVNIARSSLGGSGH